MSSTKLFVNEIVDPLAARVVIDPLATDPNRVATFDVAGVPRVDGFLEGKQAAQVPTMVTRLCGLCPVTHHLAGMKALDRLWPTAPSDRAGSIRHLLHHGSVLDVMGPRLVLPQGRQAALTLREVGKKAQALAGAPGHFPDVALPGGVREEAMPEEAAAKALIEEILRLAGPAQEIVDVLLAGTEAQPPLEAYDGADISVVNHAGVWDPLGDFLLVRLGGHEEMIPAADVMTRVRETVQGSITPCPEVLIDGTWHPYRVGPAARYPLLSASRAQAQSLQDSLTAIVSLAVELRDSYAFGRSPQPDEPARMLADGTGTGIVDGPRGLLIHHYEVADGVLQRCQILSPTAQNEPWLAQMLTRAYATHEPGSSMNVDMEAAVRAADPCLPCTQAPAGMMNIQIVDTAGAPIV